MDCSRVQRQRKRSRQRQLRKRMVCGIIALSGTLLSIYMLANTGYKTTAAYVDRGIEELEAADILSINNVSDIGMKKETVWNLTLVNKWNPVDEDLVNDIELVQLRNGQSVDARCYPFLQEMMDDCRKAGFNPIIASSFRTRQKQQDLFTQQIHIYMNDGMNREDAEAKTLNSVAVPGTSEHQLGLAVDITDIDNQKIVSGMETQEVQQWLMKNSWRYGFILRYPLDKSDITGIVYEPWHYRYVGYDAAKYIYENQITLEEYTKIFMR